MHGVVDKERQAGLRTAQRIGIHLLRLSRYKHDGARPPHISARNSAAVMPRGTETSVARPSCSTEPTMACRTPPTVIGLSGPANAIDLVQKLRCVTAAEPLTSV